MGESEHSQKALGAVLRKLRDERGRTLGAVAQSAEMTPELYGAVEQGRFNPTWDIMRRIARALEVSVAEIARREEAQDGEKG